MDSTRFTSDLFHMLCLQSVYYCTSIAIAVDASKSFIKLSTYSGSSRNEIQVTMSIRIQQCQVGVEYSRCLGMKSRYRL